MPVKLFATAVLIAMMVGGSISAQAQSSSGTPQTSSPSKVQAAPSDNAVVLGPQEILDEANDAVSTARDSINLVFLSAGLIFTVLLATVGYLTRIFSGLATRVEKLETAVSKTNLLIASLEKETKGSHGSLKKEIDDWISVKNKRAEGVKNVTSRMPIGLLARMDKKEERRIMDAWIQSTEEHISIDEIESIINNDDLFDDLKYDVFTHMGHYCRSQAFNMDSFAMEKASSPAKIYYRKALSYYRRALARLPGDNFEVRSDLFANVGACQNWLGNFERSVPAFQKSIALRQENGHVVPAVAYEALGYALMKLRDFKRAEETYFLALPSSNEKEKLCYNVACNYSLWGDQFSDGEDESNEKYSLALKYLRKIKPNSVIVEHSQTDPELIGLRNHPDHGQAFEDWGRDAVGQP